MASLASAQLHDDEAAAVGVYPGDMNNWGEKIKPLLVAKGFPESELFLGNRRVRTFRLEDQKITQFELLDG